MVTVVGVGVPCCCCCCCCCLPWALQKSGTHLYQTCPSGDFWEYKAMAIGARSQSAKTYLEKNFESFPGRTCPAPPPLPVPLSSLLPCYAIPCGRCGGCVCACRMACCVRPRVHAGGWVCGDCECVCARVCGKCVCAVIVSVCLCVCVYVCVR